MLMKTISEAMMSVKEFSESEMMEMLWNQRPMTIFPPNSRMFPAMPIHTAAFSARVRVYFFTLGTIRPEGLPVNLGRAPGHD